MYHLDARAQNYPDGGQGCVTDCPDSEGSNFPLEVYNEESNGGDGWDAMEAIFTQHDQSLTQGDVSCSEGEGEDEGEPAAKRLFDEINDNTCMGLKPNPPLVKRISSHDDCMDEIFASNEFDDELLDIVARVDAEHSPKKPTSRSNYGEISVNHAVTYVQKDLAAEAGRLPMTTSAKSKKRRQALDPASNKRRHSSTLPAQITNFFQSSKKQKVGGDSLRTPIIEKKARGDLVTIRLRGKKTSFKKGDVWVPQEKKLRDKGFAFTLGNIVAVGMVHEAHIDAAWMRLEYAFIGAEEASRVKERLKTEWVLVKKHDMLPESGMIQLKNLSHRLTENAPKGTAPICYEMDGKIAHAFYYENGSRARSPLQYNRPRALDLFAGAGGMSIGLERAKFDVKYKVEMNRTASNTLLMNFPGSLVFCEDVAKFLTYCRGRRVDIYPRRGDAEYIHGSPPCQGFSSGVNTSGGANDHQNNECTIKFLEVIEYLQPAFVSMENVPGLGHEKNIKYLLHLVSGLLKMSYQVRTCPLKATDFGDPQNRCRVIVLASKKGYKLPVLKATHGEGKLDVITARDAIGDLEDIYPVPGTGLVNLPNGGHVWDHFREGTDLREKSDKQYILDAELPANTVRKGNLMRHYKHDRYITARERARLQNFPDGHRFAGSRQEIFDQVGNAVPIELATAIGRAVMESYRLGRCNVTD